MAALQEYLAHSPSLQVFGLCLHVDLTDAHDDITQARLTLEQKYMSSSATCDVDLYLNYKGAHTNVPTRPIPIAWYDTQHLDDPPYFWSVVRRTSGGARGSKTMRIRDEVATV